MSLTIKVIIATHKLYEMPTDELYIPVHVGAAGKDSIGYQRDDEGENISIFNPYFCELTGLYWAWKNLTEDYIGLVHYRRLFKINGEIITKKQIKVYLGKVKLFIPNKRHYYIETLESHYNHTHYYKHLDTVRNVLIRKCPQYNNSYKKVINRTWGYMFNIMIMKNELLDDYCKWLFDILFDIFNQIDTSNYSVFAKRYIGRISEILFNVWLEQKISSGMIKKKEIMELDYTTEENWLIKIPAFLKAKFFKKKYEKSF